MPTAPRVYESRDQQKQKLAQKVRRDEQRRDYDRGKDPEIKRWYNSARWKRLRLAQLKSKPLCTECEGGDRVTQASVVDHIIPHKGDEQVFFDASNLQSMCKPHHDSKTARLDGGFGRFSSHPYWLSPSLIPLVIVCGPPGAGKSTYVKKHAKSNDLIIDLDIIAQRISGCENHGWDRKYLREAGRERNRLLASLSRLSDWDAAWLIVGEPKSEWRQWWVDTIEPQEIIVLETQIIECMKRVVGSHRLGAKKIIRQWWRSYSRRDGDVVMVGSHRGGG